MKKNKLIYTLCAATLLFANTACEDFLTEHPESSYEKDNYFVNTTNANMAVVGIYDALAKLEHYGQYEMAMPTSDDMYFIKGTGTDNTRRDVSHYMVKPENQWTYAVWKWKYAAIDRANYAIEGIEGMDSYKDKESRDYMTLRKYIAEAKFLRAFCAFDLVKYFGDVPFKTTYTSVVDEAYGSRKDCEEIYDQIIQDLNDAKTDLSWANETSSPERATQGAARALLMRVYLQRAGYKLKATGTDYGKKVCPDETTRQKYFGEVIKEWEAFQQNGYHDLYSAGFDGLFKGFSAGVINSKESLFEIAFFNVSGENEDSGNWGTYIGQEVEAPGPEATAEESLGRANAFFRVVPQWKDFYEENDVRRDITICDSKWYWNKIEKKQVRTTCYKFKKKGNENAIDEKGYWIPNTDKQGNPQLDKASWTPGKWRREWMPIGYKEPNNTDVNFCALRYADVILMAAEAYNETGDTPMAWNLLNKIRERSHATLMDGSNYASIYKAPKVLDLPFIDDSDEKGKFRTALYWERGFELAFEGQRKYDLIRWNVLPKALELFGNNDKINNSYNASKDTWTYNYPAFLNFTENKHELFPIPLDEIQLNQKLEGKNNPGY